MAADPAVVQALQRTDLFSSLSKKALADIASQARLVDHSEGKEITEEGGGAAGFHLIQSGTASVTVGGHERGTLGPGQYFGEMVLDSQPRSASVMTLEPAQFAVLSSADFRAFLLRHPEVALQVIQNLIRVARGLNQNVRSLAMLDVYGRVARILLELAVEQGGKLVIPEKLTQKDIAARVGASREMINRILRDLTTGGYVTVEAGRITINKAPPARW